MEGGINMEDIIPIRTPRFNWDDIIRMGKNPENFKLYNTGLNTVYTPFIRTSLEKRDEILNGFSEEETAQKLIESYNEINNE